MLSMHQIIAWADRDCISTVRSGAKQNPTAFDYKQVTADDKCGHAPVPGGDFQEQLLILGTPSLS